MNNPNELHHLENAVYFTSQTDDDRKEKEEKEEEEIAQQEIEEEENSDWGNVDPASGPAPSAPGSAV